MEKYICRFSDNTVLVGGTSSAILGRPTPHQDAVITPMFIARVGGEVYFMRLHHPQLFSSTIVTIITSNNYKL